VNALIFVVCVIRHSLSRALLRDINAHIVVSALKLVCIKAFIEQGTLMRHQYIHSGERPYTCGVCNKAFRGQGHLITHQRTLSGEHP
jgi:uncharacterized Zn-finger protein